MIDKFFLIIKKVVMAAIFIYSYDVIAVSLKTNIPINFITLSLVSFFGVFAMISLIIFSFII